MCPKYGSSYWAKTHFFNLKKNWCSRNFRNTYRECSICCYKFWYHLWRPWPHASDRQDMSTRNVDIERKTHANKCIFPILNSVPLILFTIKSFIICYRNWPMPLMGSAQHHTHTPMTLLNLWLCWSQPGSHHLAWTQLIHFKPDIWAYYLGLLSSNSQTSRTDVCVIISIISWNRSQSEAPCATPSIPKCLSFSKSNHC